jgi:hypothetical protein
VVLLPPRGQRDPAALVAVIAREQIGTVNFVPSMLQLFLAQDDLRGAAALHRVPCGGEALPPALVRRFRERLPGVRLHNRYGPTEAAVAVSGEVPAAEAASAAGSVPIGRPTGNVRAYIVDGGGAPVPVGVVGELYLGGAGVARGYLNRAGLTAERFVPDPFGRERGARLYRTGDLSRWRGDGTIEFLGRNDFQVKVRGFRVELGEIEARLQGQAGVREAVVVARPDGAGDQRLVAYWVGAERVSPETLRTALSETLPEHMVPAAYVQLAAFPLTPNGKLDRGALPAPEGEAYARRGAAEPASEAEVVLAGIWSEVLGIAGVGRWDHFFELGGHSLLAVRVLSRVREVFGAEVSLGAVFERPVLADFAAGLEAASRAALPPIEHADRSAALPLSFAQQRLWFLEQLSDLGNTYHISRRLRLRGDLDRDALRRALDRLIARHEALRTTFHEVSGQPVQRIADAASSAFHLIEHDLRADGGAEATLDTLVVDETRRRFDLARGPLIRGRLIRLAADDHVLLLTMHHIVSDAWSMGVVARELSALYEAYRTGEVRCRRCRCNTPTMRCGNVAGWRASGWRTKRSIGARPSRACRSCSRCRRIARARRGWIMRGRPSPSCWTKRRRRGSRR